MKIQILLGFLALGLAGSSTLASDHVEAPKGVTGWEAFGELQKGNKRFYEGNSEHPKQDEDRRGKLAESQSPHTIILSCSDSRVPPELVFDQGLGELFPIRIAGQVATTEAIASIEYAVAHLGSKLLVVMGHESCGAVKAALKTPVGKSAGSPHIDKLISEIRPNIEKEGRHLASDDKTFRGPVKAHVHVTIQDILRKSNIIREAVAKDKLVLAEGIYSLKTGKVEFWDVGEKFMGLTEESTRSPASVVEAGTASEETEHGQASAQAHGKKKAHKPQHKGASGWHGNEH